MILTQDGTQVLSTEESGPEGALRRMKSIVVPRVPVAGKAPMLSNSFTDKCSCETAKNPHFRLTSRKDFLGKE